MQTISRIHSTLNRVKDLLVRERLLLVQESYNRPLRSVAQKFSYPHTKVAYWKKRYEKQGVRGLYTKPRSGRPPKITSNQSAHIRRTVTKHNMKQGWRTQQVRQLIVEETGVKYCFRHTIRILQSWGLSKIKPRPRYAFSKQEDREAFLKKTRATWHASH